MKHDAAWYTNAFEIMNKTEILLVFLLFGLCFAALIKPYVKKRLTVTAAGVLTALEGVLIWLLSDNGGTLSYSIVMFSAFVLMYLCEKERPLQKIFLCAMFLSLRFICSALLVEWGFLSIWIDINIGNISAKMDPDQIIVFYALSRMMNVIVRTLILYAMIRLFRKAYRRNEELSFKELLLLLIPTVTPLLEGAVFMEYVSIYAQGVENGYIQNNIPPDIVRFLFYLFSFAAVMLMVHLYERVRKDREDISLIQALEKEITQVQRNIEQTQALHEQIRSLRHDISNHLMTMERLSEKGNNTQAKAYLERMKEEYSESIKGIRCGDPVIDAVLDSKRELAEKKGIEFQCDLLYPHKPLIDVFDLSVILNNALDNALRGAGGRTPWISICSNCRENFMTIIIKNSYEGGALPADDEGIPFSTKTGEGHGLGLKLIRRMAQRYHGEIEFLCGPEEVELRVLLQEK